MQIITAQQNTFLRSRYTHVICAQIMKQNTAAEPSLSCVTLQLQLSCVTLSCVTLQFQDL